MGSLGRALWPAVIVCATIVIPATLLLIRNARELNILLLGEDEAKHLGVDSERLKRNIIVCTALSVGAAVAVSGIIGFVGLVVPHLIRLTIGPDHRLLIPASALLGALLLTIADTFARTIVSPAEIPVGILTSLIGGPFFLWLLVKQYVGRFGI
jgi:iron complex transport system permease protein